MDTYTRTAAAELLGVSRQTVYRHVKQDPERYTVETDNGERVITLRGLEELRIVLHRQTQRYKARVTDTQQDVTQAPAAVLEELDRERERTRAALEDVTRLDTRVTALQLQLDTARESINTLTAEKTMLYELLRDAQRKIPDAKPVGIVARVLRLMQRNKEPGDE